MNLDNDVDRLYGAPRDEFIRERNELAKRLRASGQKEAAAEVAALRKPTVVAWTVNQLAHTQRREVDLLLDAGKRIVDAQQTSISSGGRSELDTAQTSLRNAVQTLTGLAAKIPDADPTQTTLTRVAETLRTAATDPNGRELLARGHLTEELNATGWEIVAGLSPRPKTRAKPPDPATRRTDPAPEIKALTKRLRDLNKSRAAAETRQHKAHDQERAAAQHLQQLHIACEAAEAELKTIQEDIVVTEQRINQLGGKGDLSDDGGEK